MAMSRLLHVFISCLMLLSLGAADLPRPCVGDGMGNPCAIESCACSMACTCKSHCMDSAEAPPGSGEDASSHAACHMGPSAPADATLAHFSLPDPRPPALLPPSPISEWPAVAPDRYRPSGSERFASRSLSPAEPPPRVTV